jgi:hypothetical protein
MRKLNRRKHKFNKCDEMINGLLFPISAYSEFLFKVYDTGSFGSNEETPIDEQLENIGEVEKLSYEENIGCKKIFKFKG